MKFHSYSTPFYHVIYLTKGLRIFNIHKLLVGIENIKTFTGAFNQLKKYMMISFKTAA